MAKCVDSCSDASHTHSASTRTFELQTALKKRRLLAGREGVRKSHSSDLVEGFLNVRTDVAAGPKITVVALGDERPHSTFKGPGEGNVRVSEDAKG